LAGQIKLSFIKGDILHFPLKFLALIDVRDRLCMDLILYVISYFAEIHYNSYLDDFQSNCCPFLAAHLCLSSFADSGFCLTLTATSACQASRKPTQQKASE